jgi:16S rRNA G527 N7-methylase RsmG
MVEKASKKVAFLRKAVAALHLESVEILEGLFPEAANGLFPNLITARAVETPEKILPHVLRIVETGAVFLCQAPENRIDIPNMFHVEHIQDKWTVSNLRRGNLYIVKM